VARLRRHGPATGVARGAARRRRATLLRRLERPATATQISEWLDVVPSAVTYQLNAMESAGLVVRERHGRHVTVRRTARATQLLASYDVR
jgi:DNA-binding transcriptional ArsR family regulator